MEISIIKKRELVVAIDFGSTYTGYAWQWRADFLNNRSNVQFNNNWGTGALQLHKTSTCMLLEANEKDGGMEYKVDSFGQMAEDIYKTLCKENENDIHGKWYFFKRFKHLLYSKGFHQEIQVEDQIGQPLPLLDVVAKFIEALKNHFIKNLEQKGQHVEMDKILWVVTVPAIWSDEAKAFMRKAAEMSGIKKKNLLLALEPEAAAIYCIHLPDEQKANMNELGTPGQVFLTADLG
ncbi:heat shock 70 kDa protein 12B-like, partial [Mercenaria mercenaria]|uniref:heat shock 70 kDa protein 12B-like n=1 Tax=Mercenaria mercenaria TaxID=6596 RepID=UPI00234F8F9B